MSVQAVVGGNWGDEGKGKMTDYLAQKSDYVVRFQGGNNAGHTIVNEYGTFKLHLLPSGVFNKNTINILSSAVALNMKAFLTELNEVLQSGVPKPIIYIDTRTQIVLPHHILLDKLEEKRLGNDQFGSTQTGMSPFYSDKYKKIGIQVCDLFDYNHLYNKVKRNIEHTNVLMEHLYQQDCLDPKEITEELMKDGEMIKAFICDTRKLLLDADKQGKNILFEGQLGALKDPDHGIYPMTTSSSPLSSFAPVSTGVPASSLKKVTTVVKAYSSAVGAGAFISEIHGETADLIRKEGNEYGATTDRPRRIGWFDAVASRYGCELQHTTEVVLSLLDVLGCVETIPICIAYEIDGKQVFDFPPTVTLEKAKPVYEEHKGWRKDISQVKIFDELPIEAKNYVWRIENLLGFPIKYVSVGPERDSLIEIVS
ncbi:MAG: adenylosuccinate synthase [Lachnospiraceae bacterium]